MNLVNPGNVQTSMGAHFLCNCYLRTARKRIFARVALAIYKGHSLSRARMLSSGQGQAKTGWYICHAVAAGGWMVLFISALR